MRFFCFPPFLAIPGVRHAHPLDLEATGLPHIKTFETSVLAGISLAISTDFIERCPIAGFATREEATLQRSCRCRAAGRRWRRFFASYRGVRSNQIYSCGPIPKINQQVPFCHSVAFLCTNLHFFCSILQSPRLVACRNCGHLPNYLATFARRTRTDDVAPAVFACRSGFPA